MLLGTRPHAARCAHPTMSTALAGSCHPRALCSHARDSCSHARGSCSTCSHSSPGAHTPKPSPSPCCPPLPALPPAPPILLHSSQWLFHMLMPILLFPFSPDFPQSFLALIFQSAFVFQTLRFSLFVLLCLDLRAVLLLLALLNLDPYILLSSLG